MADKRKGFFSSLTQIPELIGKVSTFIDNQVESKTHTASNVDAQTIKRFEKSLPDLIKNSQTNPIKRKTYDVDLQAGASEYAFKDKVSAISFDTLYRMSMRDSIVSSIIVTRTNQISNFSRPQRDRYSMGYSFTLRDHNREMTEEDVEQCSKLEEWLLNCGIKQDRDPSERMTFEEFLRRIIPDRLTYDAISIEIIPCEDGSIHHFLPVSSSTIRFANKRIAEVTNMFVSPEWFGVERQQRPDDLEPDAEDYRYVQVYKNMIIDGFSDDEMIYRQANPTNEPTTNGYSVPELERLVAIIASHVYAETHNKQFFTGGFTAPGLLHFKDDIPQEQMDGFRRSWETQTTGAGNSFRTPILATEGEVNWIPINVSNKDMEWKEWMNYLIKITCAVFQIDPSEIGFWDLSQGGASLNEGNRNEQIIKHSRDKGLRPMLRLVESIINEEILPRLGEEIAQKYEFRFVGLETEERMEEVDRHAIEVKSKKTVNQVRRESGMTPLPNMDNIILDQTYLTWWQANSPEAIEMRVRNFFLEQILVEKYEKQLPQFAGRYKSGAQGDQQTSYNGGSENPDNFDLGDLETLEMSEKNNPSLVKVEYFKAN